jgi:hypothetical protein
LATRVSIKIYTAADNKVGFLKRFEVNFIKKTFTLLNLEIFKIKILLQKLFQIGLPLAGILIFNRYG